MRFARLARLAAPLAVAALLTGCPPPEGEQGLMTFTVRDRVAGLFGGMPPLAVGIDVPIDVEGVGPLSPQRIEDASLEPAGFARLRVVSDTRVVITAQRPGRVALVVKTAQGEERIDVELADTARIEPFLVEAGPRKVVEGGVERFMIARVDADDRLIAGERALQGPAQPAGAVELVDGEPHEASLRYLAPGDHTVTVDKLRVQRTVVALDEITAVRYGAAHGHDGDLRGLLLDVWAVDAVGERVDGLEGALAVESLTPSICAARVTSAFGASQLEVTAHAAGDCRLQSRLGDVERRDTLPVE